MTTTCLTTEMREAYSQTQEVQSQEEHINEFLDAVNIMTKRINNLSEKIDNINTMARNFTCEYEDAPETLEVARGLIDMLRKFIARHKNNQGLYITCKKAINHLSENVDLFEEYMQDFKFRHNINIQKSIQEKFSGLTFAV